MSWSGRPEGAEPLPGLRRSFRDARVTPPRPKPRPPERPAETSAAGAILLVALLALAAFAAQSSLRRAFAAYWTAAPDASRLAMAIEIDPLNPVARRREAFLAAQTSGDPAQAAPGLRRAVELAPFDIAPRLELAAALQASGTDREAEAALLEAAELDQSYAPRWSLMNFYLRTGRTDDFWESARGALLAHPESAPAVLGLCWRAFGDSTLILERAVPDSPAVYRRYLAFLLEHDRLEASIELWPKLAPVMEEADAPMASLFLERLIRAQRVEQSVAVWNHLCRRSFISHIPLSFPEGPYLTNANFATRISGLGFDWETPPAEGVLRVQQPAAYGARALEVRLSGLQSDDVLLLSQVVPLPPGHFQFRYEYATEGLPRASGLFWLVRDAQTGGVLAQAPATETTEAHGNANRFAFDAPQDVRFVHLELRYLNPGGSDSHRGRYILRQASLSAAGPPGAAE